MSLYSHRQSSLLIPTLMLLPALAVIAAAARIAHAQHPVVFAPLALVAVVLIVPAVGFSSLTVEVTDGELTWFFGPGVWRKRIDRRDVASVAAVRNPWWYGFGIHLTRHGWLYNIAGYDAIEITLVNGRTLRIGTDEPDALVAALRRLDTP